MPEVHSAQHSQAELSVSRERLVCELEWRVTGGERDKDGEERQGKEGRKGGKEGREEGRGGAVSARKNVLC